jgi:hypothetical protein
VREGRGTPKKRKEKNESGVCLAENYLLVFMTWSAYVQRMAAGLLVRCLSLFFISWVFFFNLVFKWRFCAFLNKQQGVFF